MMADALEFNQESIVGVAGAGAMGAGIAQIAATNGHSVVVYDAYASSLKKAQAKLTKILARQIEKGRMKDAEVEGILSRITWTEDRDELSQCSLVVEAVIEDLEVKKELFRGLEERVSSQTILATNTSSLSIAAIAASVERPERVLGVHFFNPAPLMPLVEIIPGLRTDPAVTRGVREIIDRWGKTTVLAKDTPGFIVNRIARPFYGESLRLHEEGVASVATIDWALKSLGGFPMGPFELMDFIGNDVNFKVTKTVYAAFYYDPRYRPAFTQQRLAEAGLWGRKSGRGYYDYGEGAIREEPVQDEALGRQIVDRVVAMLINEAVDALFWQVASKEDIDLAMTKGVRYPKGLLAWADDWGLDPVLGVLEGLQHEYGEDRYRPSPLLRRMVASDTCFFP
jgi:3-hydroxybutyryl-CoA dehydrogenase